MGIPYPCYNEPPGRSERRRRKKGLEADELSRRIIEVLSDKQAEDVLLLDIRSVASFADYFVIASAPSVRQIQAILEAIDASVHEDGVSPMGREGEAGSGWVLLDYGDVIVHLFSAEQRAFYAIEELWRQAKPVVRIQ